MPRFFPYHLLAERHIEGNGHDGEVRQLREGFDTLSELTTAAEQIVMRDDFSHILLCQRLNDGVVVDTVKGDSSAFEKEIHQQHRCVMRGNLNNASEQK